MINMENRGIITKDSQIKIGSLAIGEGATVINGERPGLGKEYEEIFQKLNECAELIKTNGKSLDNVDELLDSISIIKAQFESKSPNRTTIKGIINEMTLSVASVASLATAIGVLRSAILAIL
jgi:hypothetical protein